MGFPVVNDPLTDDGTDSRKRIQHVDRRRVDVDRTVRLDFRLSVLGERGHRCRWGTPGDLYRFAIADSGGEIE